GRSAVLRCAAGAVVGAELGIDPGGDGGPTRKELNLKLAVQPRNSICECAALGTRANTTAAALLPKHNDASTLRNIARTQAECRPPIESSMGRCHPVRDRVVGQQISNEMCGSRGASAAGNWLAGVAKNPIRIAI